VPARSYVVWSLVALCAVWVIVRAFGLERGFPLVQALAYTPLVAGAALVLVLVSALLRVWAAALAALVLAGALVAFVAPRALGGPSPADGGSGPRLRVLTANLYQEPAAAREIVALAREQRADVLTVQELTPASEQALEDAGIDAVLPHSVTVARLDTSGAAVYSRDALSRRPPASERSAVAAGLLHPAGGPPVEVLAVHPAAPRRGGDIGAWRAGLRALPATDRNTVRILAGDFNATLDHAELRRVLDRGYEDAAAETGVGLRATWPTGRRLPPPVTIDHVLADARCGWREVRVLPVAHSDHRAVLAEVVLPRRR
jgi:endonuclease/exonuclease/phosphatase (EEP) superfamily protein YafD